MDLTDRDDTPDGRPARAQRELDARRRRLVDPRDFEHPEVAQRRAEQGQPMPPGPFDLEHTPSEFTRRFEAKAER